MGFLGSSNLGVLSPQILSEFFVVVTRKIPHPLSIAQAERSISNYLRSWRVYDLTGLIALEAVLAVGKHGMNYWDALVWATARLYQIPVILSEDFTDRAFIQGVRFLNPFNPYVAHKANWIPAYAGNDGNERDQIITSSEGVGRGP